MWKPNVTQKMDIFINYATQNKNLLSKTPPTPVPLLLSKVPVAKIKRAHLFQGKPKKEKRVTSMAD